MLNSFWKECKRRKDDSKKLVDEFYSHDEDDQTQEESEPEELKENEIEETKTVARAITLKNKRSLGLTFR